MKSALHSPILWLSLTVMIGIANMAAGRAPPHYMAINAIALVVAVAAIHFAPALKTGRVTIALSAAAILALIAPLLFGPDLEGVSRWIGTGPVQLHSGMLVIPTLVALLPRLKSGPALVAMALACIAIAMQPDRASAIALLSGTWAALFTNRSASNTIQLLFASVAVCVIFVRPDAMQPVAFVENVLSDAWLQNPLLAVAIAASLAAALILPAMGNRQLVPVEATIAGFAIASLLGAYPTPLIGYGAAAILGFGVGVAAARQPVR